MVLYRFWHLWRHHDVLINGSLISETYNFSTTLGRVGLQSLSWVSKKTATKLKLQEKRKIEKSAKKNKTQRFNLESVLAVLANFHSTPEWQRFYKLFAYKKKPRQQIQIAKDHQGNRWRQYFGGRRILNLGWTKNVLRRSRYDSKSNCHHK